MRIFVKRDEAGKIVSASDKPESPGQECVYDIDTDRFPEFKARLAEEAWLRLREERNRLLAETDYTQLMDSPEASRAEFATYRQALRDLPQVTADPRKPVWPVVVSSAQK